MKPLGTAISIVIVIVTGAVASAHAGPPYPIVTDRAAGPYSISIWTDPDATEDRSLGGQFWVVIEPRGTDALPAATRATVAVRPLDRDGAPQRALADPVRGNVGNQFAALLMDHEGPYAVTVTVDGPLGPAAIAAHADATFDLRPAPYMLAWYLLPFVVVGLLWGRLLIRRRRSR